MVGFLAGIGRLIVVVVGSWIVVLTPPTLASLLPKSWQLYVDVPPLLLLALLVVPVAACAIWWRWILGRPRERIITPQEWIERR